MDCWNRHCRWITGLLCGWLLVAFTATTHADEALQRYFDQLRQRGLFSLAEHAALSRLNDPLLLPDRRTELVIELAQTLADHAAYVTANQQAELWKQADDVLQAEQQRSSARAPLLELQRTLLIVSQAQLLRWEVLLSPHDVGLRARWLQTVHAALTALETHEQQFDERLRAARRDNSSGIEPFEQRQLLAAIRLERGELLRDRAAEPPADNPQRAADLVDAANALRQSLSGAVDVRAITRSKLGLADCMRLEHDYDRAREMCLAILKAEPTLPDDLRDAVTACRLRTWLDENQALTAAQELLTLRQSQHVLSGELWFVQLQTLLALRDVATRKQDTDLSQTLSREAELALDRVREQAGGRWARYCQRLWERDAAVQSLGAELDRWLRSAQSQARDGQLAEAVSAYATAITLAEKQQQADLAVDLRYTRGSLLLDLQDFTAAATELQTIVTRSPQHPKAPSASLLAAYALGRLYDTERTQARREAYTAALDQHLAGYPQDVTADDARLMLAQLEEQRLQLSKALPLYLAIAPQHPQSVAATAGALRCYEGLIQRLQQLQRDWQPFHQQARLDVEQRARIWTAAPTDWTAQQGDIALGCARLSLNAQPPDYEAAAHWLNLLTQAIASHSHTTGDWKRLADEVLPLRLIALAGTGQSVAAQQLLVATAGQDPQSWLAVIQGLQPLTEGPASPQNVDLQELLRSAIRKLEPLRTQLSAAEQREFDLSRVKTLLVTGEITAAVQIATALSTQFPQDRHVQMALGESLTRSRDPAAVALAVTVWRRLETMETPGSFAWLTARVEVIEALAHSGEQAEAAKLLTVTRVLYPRIEDQRLQMRLQQITERLQSPRSK